MEVNILIANIYQGKKNLIGFRAWVAVTTSEFGWQIRQPASPQPPPLHLQWKDILTIAPVDGEEIFKKTFFFFSPPLNFLSPSQSSHPFLAFIPAPLFFRYVSDVDPSWSYNSGDGLFYNSASWVLHTFTSVQYTARLIHERVYFLYHKG